ncbi:methyltransferase domain-containing protein [Patescibacteria group bacterium]|nr:methyltransferase domain-containing protein [Patescibacteria group bacterium]
MKKDYAEYLLEKTRQDYDAIADDFDKKRDYLPPDFAILQDYVDKGDRILDLGCGNGRFQEVIKDRADYYGTDVSGPLIRIAKAKYSDAKFFVSKPLSLPFEDNFFDKVFCLAVFHHIPSARIRKEFLKEIRRVLKPDGRIVLTVWDLSDNKKARQLLLKYALLKLIGRTKLDFKDVFYPWKNSAGKVVINRYIHIFSENELEKIIESAGLVIKEKGILERSPKGKNIFIIAQKSK